MDLLSVKNITKRFAHHTALQEVSISVPPQSIFGLLGPNGAGKTTLIRIINQIHGPDSGEIYFEGNKMLPEHVNQIGYLPEERGLYKKMKVGEHVLYLAQLKGMNKQEAKKKVKEWFEKFELLSWWNKKVEELSKGMQQKIQFISTVLHQPKLLILDEPFSGFDPINTDLVKNEILQLKKNGTTVIFSTHNMESVEEICDHIALINKSKKILDGSVKEIRKQYQANTYEITFEGNMIAFANAMWTGAELVDHKVEDTLNKAKVKLLNNTPLNNLIQAILPYANIHAIQEVVPTMRDIFIQKVGEIQ